MATLTYPPIPRLHADHYYVPACFAAAMQAQEFRRSGADVPLSMQYLTIKAAESPDVTIWHGWSSGILGMELCRTYGSCPASMCPSLMTRVTPEIEAAALDYRTGQDFATFADVPDYPSALAYLTEHPGAVCVLTTYGRAGYAILGVDGNGLGVWFDANHVGKPIVGSKSHADGAAIWQSMLYDVPHGYGPENFVVIVTQR